MNILRILSVESLRDGGSLIISFQADDSCEYWLMLPMIARDADDIDFGTPVLINRTTAVEVDLSWEGAKAWLCKLEYHIQIGKYESPLSRMKAIIHAHI